MVQKCHSYGVKHIFVWSCLHKNIILNNQQRLVKLYHELNVDYVDNLIIYGFHHFKDGLLMLESGKRLLANNFIFNFSKFLAKTQQSHWHICQEILGSFKLERFR